MNSTRLTEQEHLDFIRNGFVIKRGVFSDEACSKFRDSAWRELSKKSIDTDPSTWRKHHYLRPRKGVVKLRDEVTGDIELLNALKANQAIQDIAKDLIGGPTTKMIFRGLYPTFPVPALTALPYDAHVEEHLVQVFAMVYIDDVTTRNGAFCVWPGTHRDVTNHFDSKLDFAPRSEFPKVFEKLNRLAPKEITGKAGDVCFCHHRILHAGSNNLRDKVRLGILVDFLHEDYETLRRSKPSEDIWDYWSDTVRAAAAKTAALHPVRPARSPIRQGLLAMGHTLRRLRGKKPYSYAP